MPIKKQTRRAASKQKLDGLSELAKSGKLEDVWRHIESLWMNRQTAKSADEEAKQTQAEVLPILQGYGIEKVTTQPNGVRASVITGTRIVVDKNKLRRKLGAKRWQAITTREIDKAKLEQAIADGLVDPIEVAECSEEIDTTPYIRTDAPRGKK